MSSTERKTELLRRILACVAIAVTTYYLFWRVTENFNPNALLFSWALWIAELFGFITTALFYFTVWRPLKRTAPPPLEGRTVDVFIPTKSEPVDVLRKTLLACNEMTYPHRTVVLDDGGRDEIEELCKELKCIYIARPTHGNAKAGNINFGLRRSEAEFIAIFDADHVPLPHFIDRLIGYFKNDRVGFVQSPQAFYNIDSFMHRVDHRKRYVWGEQGLFYDLIQPGRDRWNAAYFVGSCALLRRKALDDIDGLATGSITEDMMTSIRLQAKGWSSVYHNESLAYGIAAETILP
ncbi:MAG: glycosyltransferase, partial [Candidatus Krumholzibacteria bacterium]|nr:glycosyltransferase [Candidatus Krumholzibacteria bacterium]